MTSPLFTINTSPITASKSVAASGAVTLALVSTDGVRSCTWTIVATDETTSAASYTLTPSGSVSQTCTTTALAAGTAATVRATINGGIDPQTEQPSGAMHAEGKFFVPTAEGFEVGCADEQNDDNRVASSTHGMIAWLNAIGRVVSAATTFVQGPMPATATDHAVMRWDGATGRLAQDSTATLTDAGVLSLAGVTATGAVQGATVVGTTSVSGTGHLAQGAAPPGAGSVRLDGVATINAGTSTALQVAGNSVLTAAAALISAAQPITVTRDALAATTAAGTTLQNMTAATGGATVQVSPARYLSAHVWDTDKGGPGGDATADLRDYCSPVSAAATYPQWVLERSIDGGAFGTLLLAWDDGGANSRLQLGSVLFLRRSGTVSIYNGGSQINLRPDAATDTLTLTTTALACAAIPTFTTLNVGSTLTVGHTVQNTTASTVGQRQDSPADRMLHTGWNTGGVASEQWEWFRYGRSINGNPSIGVQRFSSKRASGSEVVQFELANNNSTVLAFLGSQLGGHSQWSLNGFDQSDVLNPVGDGQDFYIKGGSISGTGTQTAGDARLIGGAGDGALHTGGDAIVQGGPGVTANGTARIKDSGGNTVVQVGAGVSTLGFFGGTPRAQQTITGVLSAVADANAKAVLTSIIAALAVAAGYGLAIDGTT